MNIQLTIDTNLNLLYINGILTGENVCIERRHAPPTGMKITYTAVSENEYINGQEMTIYAPIDDAAVIPDELNRRKMCAAIEENAAQTIIYKTIGPGFMPLVHPPGTEEENAEFNARFAAALKQLKDQLK